MTDDRRAQGRGVIVYLREGSVGVGHHERNGRKMRQDREDHAEAQSRENEWLRDRPRRADPEGSRRHLDQA